MLDKQCIELAKITRYEYKEILSLKNVWNNKEIFESEIIKYSRLGVDLSYIIHIINCYSIPGITPLKYF